MLETKKDINQTASIQLGPIALTIHERERHFSHPSRVRCGDYRDVNVTLSANSNLTELLQIPLLRQQLAQVLADHQLDSFVDIGTLIQLDLTGLVTVQQRWFRPDAKNLTFNNQEQKQFTRYYVGTNVVADTNASTQVGTGFSLDANLRYQHRQQEVIGEDIYSNDLIYTLVRFNKLYKDAGKDLDSPNNPWSDFVQLHKDRYHNMFIALAKQEGAVTQQAIALLEQAQKEGRALISETAFFDHMRTYLKATNTSKNVQDFFMQALIALNQLLISQFLKTEELHKASWIKKSFKVKPSHALSKKTLIAQALKLQRRACVMKETITPEF